MWKYVTSTIATAKELRVWQWFVKGWHWRELSRVIKPLVVLIVLGMALGFYFGKRGHSDSNPYWRLSNEDLRNSVLKATSRMMGYSQGREREETGPRPPDLSFKIMSDYSIEYRTISVQMSEVLAERLDSAAVSKCSGKWRSDFAYAPTSAVEMMTYASQLYCMARALPPHRSIWGWLVANFTP